MQLTLDDQQRLYELYDALRTQSDIILYVTAGQEGERTTYVGKLSMADVITHFPQIPENLDMPSHVMLQRDLDASRAKGIANYVDDNQKDFIFPGLMVIVEKFTVENVVENVFKLTIPASSFRYLVDGQGRRGGVHLLIDSTDNTTDYQQQHFDIKIIRSLGVDADNQVCVDVNTTPKSFNKSQKASMDSRQVISLFSKEVAMSSGLLKGNIDYKRPSLTPNSKAPYIWTLNQISSFIFGLTGTTIKSCQILLSEESKRNYLQGFLQKFFLQLAQNEQVNAALTRKISAHEVRQTTVLSTAVMLKSIALVAKVVKVMMEKVGGGKADWSIMDKVVDIDFSKDNQDWILRCKDIRGGYEDKAFNHKACAAYMLDKMELPMPNDLREINQDVIELRSTTNIDKGVS